MIFSLQVACTWDDIKSLRQDMDKSTAEGKVHFRGKLLQAISIMQVGSGLNFIETLFLHTRIGSMGFALGLTKLNLLIHLPYS